MIFGNVDSFELADMRVPVLSPVGSPEENLAVSQVLCIFQKLHTQ